MDPSAIAFVKAAIAFILVAGTGLSIFKLWLHARADAAPDLDRLIDGVREENAFLHAELVARIAELEERVDFAERRLMQESRPERLPSPHARTPV